MSPAETDECELWQIAALLGGDRPESSGPDFSHIAASVTPGEGPVDVTAQMMRELGIQTA